MSTTTEPAPPPVAPEDGMRWVRTDQVRGAMEWRVGAQGRECRWTVGPGHRECRRRAVARCKRGARQWWGYCGDHLYGQVLHDGVLWRQIADDEETP